MFKSIISPQQLDKHLCFFQVAALPNPGQSATLRERAYSSPVPKLGQGTQDVCCKDRTLLWPTATAPTAKEAAFITTALLTLGEVGRHNITCPWSVKLESVVLSKFLGRRDDFNLHLHSWRDGNFLLLTIAELQAYIVALIPHCIIPTNPHESSNHC